MTLIAVPDGVTHATFGAGPGHPVVDGAFHTDDRDLVEAVRLGQHPGFSIRKPGTAPRTVASVTAERDALAARLSELDAELVALSEAPAVTEPRAKGRRDGRAGDTASPAAEKPAGGTTQPNPPAPSD